MSAMMMNRTSSLARTALRKYPTSCVAAASSPLEGNSFLNTVEQSIEGTICVRGFTSKSSFTHNPHTQILKHCNKVQFPSKTSVRSYSKTHPHLSNSDDSKPSQKVSDGDLIYSDDLTEDQARQILEEQLKLMKEEEEDKIYKDWVPGTRKRPLTVSYNEEDFDEQAGPKWTLRDKRCGALGIKLGMMPVWDEWGERHACTVLFLDENIVMDVKNKEQHGYDAVVLGAGEKKMKRVKKPQLGYYNKLGLKLPPVITREFRIGGPGDVVPEPGTRIHARHFVPGQNVDVVGISKGKGFQGAMKRHNFAGMPATHGVSKSHRALGSTGQCQDPGRVFKGKKMAGRMGTDRVTVQNLRVLKIDRGRNLIYIKGAVPGNKGEFVEIKDAIKKPLWGTELIEGGADCKRPPLPTFAYEEEIDGSGKPGFDVFMPVPDKDPHVPMDVEKI